MKKEALSLAPVRKAGQGLWNLALGGRTHQGKWEPFHGLKNIGRARKEYTSGPMKGMYVRDPKSGEALWEEGPRSLKSMGKFFKQEFRGGTPTKGDAMLRQMAKGSGMTPDQYAQRLAKSGNTEALRKFRAQSPGMQTREAGKASYSIGEYAQRLSPAEKAVLQDVNQLGMREFMKKNPAYANMYLKARAGKLARNIPHKGFLVGIPAYEAYDVMANREGPSPELGTMANLGRILGSGLGFTATLPLGLVGSSLAAGQIANLGQFAGKKLDSALGNKALNPQAAAAARNPQALPKPRFPQ